MSHGTMTKTRPAAPQKLAAAGPPAAAITKDQVAALETAIGECGETFRQSTGALSRSFAIAQGLQTLDALITPPMADEADDDANTVEGEVVRSIDTSPATDPAAERAAVDAAQDSPPETDAAGSSTGDADEAQAATDDASGRADACLELEELLHAPRITAVENDQLRLQVTAAAAAGRLIAHEAKHLRAIIERNAARF